MYASAPPVPGVRQDYPSASSVVPKLSAVELEQVIKRGCGEQNLVPRAAQASQPKPVEPEGAFHVRKSHLDLFALAA